MVSWKRVLCLMVPLLLMPAVAWGFQEGGSTLIQTGAIEEPFLLRLGRGALAMAVILFVLWRFSPKRKSIDWTLVAKGVGLQFLFALLVLKTTWGRGFFSVVNDVFIALISYTLAGARFVFGSLVDYSTPVARGEGIVEIGANENGYARFAKRRVIAVDIDLEHLQAARATQDVLPVQADLTQLPFAEDSVGLCVCIDTFEHIPEAARDHAADCVGRIEDEGFRSYCEGELTALDEKLGG